MNVSAFAIKANIPGARPEGGRRGMEWSRIEALLISVGCEVIEGRGSRVRFVFGMHVGTFHRPHPAKEAKPY